MKRNIAAALLVLAVAAGVGWNIAGHRETAASLKEISLRQHSEHSQPSSSAALAGIRIRISPNDFGYEITAPADQVPQISLTAR
jgi:hypothetical protein